jgi:uncharacterized protein YqeY
MSLLDTLKAAQIAARKSRASTEDAVRASLLTTLIGEASAVGKNAGNRESTDVEVIAVAKKFLKNMDETRRLLEGSPSAREALQRLDIEEACLSEFLPKQMSSQELLLTLRELAGQLGAVSAKDMGRLMKALKEQYEGQYDGKLASQLCKELLPS